MRYGISLFVALFAVWLVWSGHYTTLLIGLGVASCLAVVAMLARMRLLDEETAPLWVPPGLVRYWPWLAWEIVKSNLDVARRILSPSLPISPRIVRVQASQTTELGRVIFANCITVTPATVSLDIEKDSISVHALSAEAAANLAGGEMNRRVKRLEAWRR